jgi:hypothetical protein
MCASHFYWIGVQIQHGLDGDGFDPAIIAQIREVHPSAFDVAPSPLSMTERPAGWQSGKGPLRHREARRNPSFRTRSGPTSPCSYSNKESPIA